MGSVFASLRRYNPFHLGFWLASNVHDFYEPDDEVPGWATIAWNTRSIDQQGLKYWESEEMVSATTPRINGYVVPGVRTNLRRVVVRPWFGRMYTLWCTEVEARIFVRGTVVILARRRAFADYDKAIAEFNGHQEPVRWALVSPRYTKENSH